MKKGFTLIELLAVIVILAIIALIATPIILGIINDARKESQERSIELYASATKNAIAKYQLNNTSSPTSFDQLDIEYDGDVVCTTKELYADGSIYLADCKVNGDAVDYTYGEQQDTQLTTYYSWSSGSIGGLLPEDAEPKLSDVNTNGHLFYLKLEVDETEKISEAYVCFKREENGTEYCLKGEPQEDKKAATYEANSALLEAIASFCSSDADTIYCHTDDFDVWAISNEYDNVGAGFDGAECVVDGNGIFKCHEW